MRRNINVYKAPLHNEGYDLIAIHPDPRRRPRPGEMPQVRIQVKSRYATDGADGFPLKGTSLDAFDFLIFVRLNIGCFYRRHPKPTDPTSPTFYTFPTRVIKRAHDSTSSWEKVRLRNIPNHERYLNDAGFERIANALGVPRPARPPKDVD